MAQVQIETPQPVVLGPGPVQSPVQVTPMMAQLPPGSLVQQQPLPALQPLQPQLQQPLQPQLQQPLQPASQLSPQIEPQAVMESSALEQTQTFLQTSPSATAAPTMTITAAPVASSAIQQQQQPIQQQEKGVPDPMDIKMETYSEKSFVLRGEGTRLYQLSIQNLGGKWNPRLRGGGAYIFSSKKSDDVSRWMTEMKAGRIQADDPSAIQQRREGRKQEWRPKSPPGQRQGQTSVGAIPGLPTTPMATTNPDMQLVQWTLFRPRKGMKAHLRVKGAIAEYDAIRTEEHNGVTDTVFISPAGNPQQVSKLVICNGAWQVWGYAEEHSVFFQ